MTALATWLSSNLWKIGIAAVGIIVVWTTLRIDVKGMKPAIATNAQAIETVKDDVTAIEKNVISVNASINRNTESIDRNTESINVLTSQQKEFHDKEEGYREARDLKLTEILRAVVKGNADR